MKKILLISVLLAATLLATGCDEVSFPREKVRGSLINICADEYDIDIDAELVGKTLFIYLPLNNLFDVMFNVSETARQRIANVLLVARRISYSTDADMQFYCIIAQDTRFPQVQLVLVRYVDDIKKAQYYNISLDESHKRMLMDINENPQAAKEQAIRDVFAKMKLGGDMQEKVLDDFFRSPPSTLEGIGYWNGKFYIKDINLPEFLSQQIANRIMMRFRDKEALKKYALKMVKGKFVAKATIRFFLITFRAEGLLFVADEIERKSMEKEIFANIFEELAGVIYGYKFKDFDSAEMVEEHFHTKLSVPRDDIYLFQERKIALDTIVGGI